ncbi:MAG: hypothetical protein QG577_2386, partial [Thermodesulfobacteriota bacterium]|nr:hypothetical protein [Thermodesulfobacteriota bacterium]
DNEPEGTVFTIRLPVIGPEKLQPGVESGA